MEKSLFSGLSLSLSSLLLRRLFLSAICESRNLHVDICTASDLSYAARLVAWRHPWSVAAYLVLWLLCSRLEPSCRSGYASCLASCFTSECAAQPVWRHVCVPSYVHANENSKRNLRKAKLNAKDTGANRSFCVQRFRPVALPISLICSGFLTH